ncbi:Hypothetical predicted protein [Mytilus galloprovincialis]|uniref:Uncharacterized protein n=1 Tax=Mytilus galloprovincialis TaxID=29158 RepID=A0A8B6G1S4_MYTGA|nr:Hypothetical predicted protein [Mytilus galloprovincialis]
MILLDDLMSTSAKDSRINDLFTEGSHHRNLSVVVLNQNLYFGKDPTQRQNCHYLVLFNNPIDRQPIMTLGRQMYPSRGDFFLWKFEEATRAPFGYLLVDLKARTPEASRLRTEVLQIGQGETHDEKKEDTHLSEDESSVSSDEDMADETTDVSSDDAERREDLIACRDCGVVFAHLRGLKTHSQQGCWKKNGIALPMTGKDVEDALSGLPVTVCCAEDLPSYVSDRPRTFVVNTDNCDQKGSHWVAFYFPASGPPEFFDSLGRYPETYQRYFRNVLIVNGPEYCVIGNQIQPNDSNTCGLYCIYYVKLRCRGLEMKTLSAPFHPLT